MRKKILAMLLATLLLFNLLSCSLINGGSDKKEPDESNNQTQNPPADDTQDEEKDPPENENPDNNPNNNPNNNNPDNNPDNNNPDNNEIKIKSISIARAKLSFEFAEDFNADDLIVTATYSDNSKKQLNKSEYTIDDGGYNSMKVGSYTISVSAYGVAKTYDVSVSPANKLKVLMIGNSFADDTINYAYEIAKSIGIPEENILIADIYIGGCSLATHWSNAQTNAAAYVFNLEREGWFSASTEKWTMEQAIMYTDWDFITFQQNSGNSGGPNSYACLQNLMDYVMDVAVDTVNNPNANPNVKFVWHQTWAYQQDSTSSAFASYGNDQMTMYNAIISCLKSKVLDKDFAAIIPNGTAIQNARTSFIGDTFSRDQYNHLSYGAGRYIASMGLVGVLTGRDMSKLTWKPTDSGFSYPIDAETILVCKESYANAVANPLEITKSKYPAEGIVDLFGENFEGTGTQNDPYLIQDADDLIKLSELTAGKSYGNSSIYFKLTSDIDVSTQNWIPICSSPDPGWVSAANSFKANFDGNGKTITFTGNYSGDSWAKGLFSAVGGHVHDLTLKGSITIEKGRVGSLASMATAGAKIENITSYVHITAGNNQAGGIIGYVAEANVTVTNCVNYGTIQGRELVGGIVGGSWKNITYINCVNHGNIIASGSLAGGIVGEKYASATLTNCSNDGTVSAGGVNATADYGSASSYAGYLVGKEY